MYTLNFFREGLKLSSQTILIELQQQIQFPRNISAEKRALSIYLVVANALHFDSKNGQPILIEQLDNNCKVSPHRSYKTERRVIYSLHEMELIDIYKAPSNRELAALKKDGVDVSEHYENDKRKRSRYWLTDKGRDYFSGVVAGIELVVRRQKKPDGTYNYYPFQENELTRLNKYENLLENLNELMASQTLQHVDVETGEIITFTNDTSIIFTGTTANTIHTKFVRGGRYYSKVATLKGENRKTVTINGKSTVEIDFKCCLPSIMFGKFGVNLSKMEHDLYYVPGENNCDYMRMLAKKIVVVMLGVTCEKGLRASIRNYYRMHNNGEPGTDGKPIERFYPEGFTPADLNRVIDKVLKKYRELAPRIDQLIFREDLATNILQGIEARIATRIIFDFVQAGKPILAIHDSFRVLAEDEDLLHKVMTEAYIAQVGMAPLGLKIDRQTAVTQPEALTEAAEAKQLVKQPEIRSNLADSNDYAPQVILPKKSNTDENKKYFNLGITKYYHNVLANEDILLCETFGELPQGNNDAYREFLSAAGMA